MLSIPFTFEQYAAAVAEWGCNCGPAALAFVLQTDLEAVRYTIPGFVDKRYTSPAMMRAGLNYHGRDAVEAIETDEKQRSSRTPHRPEDFRGWRMFDADHRVALVRLHWTGPWTFAEPRPREAERITHWIATWHDERGAHVFDCNSGVQTVEEWERFTVPKLAALYPGADGGWFPTHVWHPIDAAPRPNRF